MSEQVVEASSDHQIILGDCLAGMRGLADGSVDLIVTDPPYAISNVGMWHKGRPGKGKRRFDFFGGDADHPQMIADVMAVAEESLRVMAPHASAYWWCGHREFGPLVSLFESNGYKTRFIVWAKAAPSPPPPGSGWPSGAELCVFAWPDNGARVWSHTGVNPPPNNVITCDSFRHGQPGKADHPTQKPLGIIEPLIRASSRAGDLVLDLYTGSGTTGVACKRLGRRFLGFERDPKFHAAAVKRLDGTRQQFEFAPRPAKPKQMGLIK